MSDFVIKEVEAQDDDSEIIYQVVHIETGIVHDEYLAEEEAQEELEFLNGETKE